MKVYVGSQNKVKVGAVEEVLKEFGYEVIGVDVDSKVDSQPKSDLETIIGAYNRANALPKDGLRIGLEAGVELLENILYLTNFGVLIDNEGNVYKAGGTRLPLPLEISNLILIDGYELSDAMGKYFSVNDIKHNNGAIGHFTKDLVVRKDIFTHIVKLLYGQYLYKINK